MKRLPPENAQMLRRPMGIIDEVMLIPPRKLDVCAEVQRSVISRKCARE